MKSIIPTLPEISREALVMIAGAIIAAAIVGQMPALRAWMREQWGAVPMPTPITH